MGDDNKNKGEYVIPGSESASNDVRHHVSDKSDDQPGRDSLKNKLKPERIDLAKNNKILAITISVFALLVVGLATVYGNTGKISQPKTNVETKPEIVETEPETEPTTSNKDEQQNSIDNTKKDRLLEYDTDINLTNKEVWLASPLKLADKGYYIDPDNYGQIDYYQIGNRGDNKIIMVRIMGVGEHNDLYEEKPDGGITRICIPNANFEYKTNNDYCMYNDDLAVAIKYTNSLHYSSLTYLDSYTLDSTGSTVRFGEYPTIGTQYSTPESGVVDTKIKSIGSSTIYKRESTNVSTNLTSINYYIKTPIDTMIILEYAPLDLLLSSYKWQSGATSVDDNIRNITYGCGNARASVSRSDVITDNDVQKVGVSGDDKVVYELKDVNHPLMQKAYSEYVEFLYGRDAISINEFASRHALVLYKDNYGQWLVYISNKLAAVGGCAKPVIYLYPTIEQRIDVKVGAKVSIFDPYYDPKSGWNVVAKPDGQLIHNGNTYSSLFWEGKGYGEYPVITSGTVVAQNQVVGTIRNQLAQQGLKTNEINDFMTFWQTKIPSNPFVRLTWFNTEQMDELAPLYVTPKPTTSIRVFLDMEGLNSLINIPQQKLTSVERKGFTLVEWGGLINQDL